MLLCLEDHVCNKHRQEHQRTDHQPADLPEDVGPGAVHVIKVFTEAVSRPEKSSKLARMMRVSFLKLYLRRRASLLSYAIDVTDCNDLKKSNYEKRH